MQILLPPASGRYPITALKGFFGGIVAYLLYRFQSLGQYDFLVGTAFAVDVGHAYVRPFRPLPGGYHHQNGCNCRCCRIVPQPYAACPLLAVYGSSGSNISHDGTKFVELFALCGWSSQKTRQCFLFRIGRFRFKIPCRQLLPLLKSPFVFFHRSICFK